MGVGSSTTTNRVARAFLADHPITRAAQLTALIRFVGLVIHFFASDATGQAISAAPLVMLPFPAAYQLGSVWLLMGAFLVVWQIAGPARRSVEWIAAITFAVILFFTDADLTLQRLTGNSLTLGIVHAYGGGTLWTRDVVGRLADDGMHTALTTLLLIAGLVGIARTTWRPATGRIAWRGCVAWIALGASLVAWRRSEQFMDAAYGWPIEARLTSSALGFRRARPPENEAAAIADLRALVRLRPGEVWFGDSLPLVHGRLADLCAHAPADARCSAARDTAPTAAASDARPDILVVVIESLRGADVGYLRTPIDDRFTPNLNRLAAQSVVFPNYISNATTSPTGFFSINCSAWRHPDREILGEFSPRSFDCLAPRLRDAGYFTMYLNASNPGFDRQLDWTRPFYDVVDYKSPVVGIYNDNISEALLVDKFVEQLARHDAATPHKPFFAYVATHSTHPPFILDAPTHDLPAFLHPGDSGITPRTMPDDHLRYLTVLKYTDAQLERVFDALRRRGRADSTVIIVTGDHSITLGELEPAVFMPYDMHSWTGAIVAGPQRLIGPARRDTLPASHVDLGRTILDLAGDTRPTASIGNDLLTAGRPVTADAYAFHMGGFRRDVGGCSYYVSSDAHGQAWGQRPFQLGQPAIHPDAACPITAAEAQRIRALANYWSYLIEHDRIWNPALLDRGVTPR